MAIDFHGVVEIRFKSLFTVANSYLCSQGDRQVTKEIKLFLEFEQALILKMDKLESEVYVEVFEFWKWEM